MNSQGHKFIPNENDSKNDFRSSIRGGPVSKVIKLGLKVVVPPMVCETAIDPVSSVPFYPRLIWPVWWRFSNCTGFPEVHHELFTTLIQLCKFTEKCPCIGKF